METFMPGRTQSLREDSKHKDEGCRVVAMTLGRARKLGSIESMQQDGNSKEGHHRDTSVRSVSFYKALQ